MAGQCKTIAPPDRVSLLQRIALEKDKAVSEFMRRMHLLQQQEAALTQRPEPQGPYARLVRPQTGRTK